MTYKPTIFAGSCACLHPAQEDVRPSNIHGGNVNKGELRRIFSSEAAGQSAASDRWSLVLIVFGDSGGLEPVELYYHTAQAAKLLDEASKNEVVKTPARYDDSPNNISQETTLVNRRICQAYVCDRSCILTEYFHTDPKLLIGR